MSSDESTDDGSEYSDDVQPPASSYVALSSAALRGLPNRPIIEDKHWGGPPTADFQQRDAQRYRMPTTDTRSIPRTLQRSSASSMATQLYSNTPSQCTSSSRTPSLASSGATLLTQSMHTSSGCSALDRHPPRRLPLQPDDEDPPFFQPPATTWQCPYPFLACTTSLPTHSQWETHCQAHFRTPHGLIILPRTQLRCPFPCPWISSSGDTAWSERTRHIASQHRNGGQMVLSRRADPGLVRHLWQCGIIGGAEEQVLSRGRSLGEEGEAFLVVEGGGRRGRRRGETGRRRSFVERGGEGE